MGTMFPRMAEIVEPLQAMLEESMQGNPRRTTKVANNRDLSNRAWTDGCVRARKAAHDLVARARTVRPLSPRL